MSTMNCPCGSGRPLIACCLPLIQGKSPAWTAEDLLRSRYTAFTRGDVDYIVQSHHSKTRAEVKRDQVEEWSGGSEWLGLEILETSGGGEKDEEGAIAFHARYRLKSDESGKVQEHYERALFAREGGVWTFVDAQPLKGEPIVRAEPKLGRNDPCHCGSGKKLKKCHGV